MLPTDADPTGSRLTILRAVLKDRPYLKALFIDQATLYQPPRSEAQDAGFKRALGVAFSMERHIGSTSMRRRRP